MFNVERDWSEVGKLNKKTKVLEKNPRQMPKHKPFSNNYRCGLKCLSIYNKF